MSRIRPGTAAWTKAMRNLQGSADTALDQSMGRKAARMAAKPHVVGSIALDERLRGAGGGGSPADPSLVVLRMEGQRVFYQVSGSKPPFTMSVDGFAAAIPVPPDGLIDHLYGGWWQVSPWVEDAEGTRTQITIFVAPPRPATWLPVNVGNVPVVNGLFTAHGFTADGNSQNNPRPSVFMTGPARMALYFSEEGRSLGAMMGPATGPILSPPEAVAAGNFRFYAFDGDTGETFGFSATYPMGLPWTDIAPRSLVLIERHPNGDPLQWRVHTTSGNAVSVMLSALQTFGQVGQGVAPWVAGEFLNVLPEGGGGPERPVHWTGSVWAEGVVPSVAAAEAFPWDTMTTHAQIDGWADAHGVARGADWGQMTLASKRQWLVAYFDGATPWITGN